MLRNEFGGFNDAMYQLYDITRDDRMLWLARFFYHNDKIDPLKAGDAQLGTNHANTFIPKVLARHATTNSLAKPTVVGPPSCCSTPLPAAMPSSLARCLTRSISSTLPHEQAYLGL
jgi:hypothetical protein